jgi:hypothetical protein
MCFRIVSSKFVDVDGRLSLHNSAISATLCLCPSASTPPGILFLLQTKGEVQFDRAMTARSKPFFLLI